MIITGMPHLFERKIYFCLNEAFKQAIGGIHLVHTLNLFSSADPNGFVWMWLGCLLTYTMYLINLFNAYE
jgi:hypothetical protein